MLTEKQKEKLKANWGAKADAMECKAEARIYDPLSPWCCYIYAMNPSNEDEIATITKGFGIEVGEWTMKELEAMFNAEGEKPVVDTEFRPRLASDIYKRMTEGNL